MKIVQELLACEEKKAFDFSQSGYVCWFCCFSIFFPESLQLLVVAVQPRAWKAVCGTAVLLCCV